jgi:hypothetical protein
MPEEKRDYVAEYLVKRNAAAAARPNPLFPDRPAPEPEVDDPNEDQVARFIRRRNAVAASQPSPLRRPGS